jgi:hypothetical protein
MTDEERLALLVERASARASGVDSSYDDLFSFVNFIVFVVLFLMLALHLYRVGKIKFHLDKMTKTLDASVKEQAKTNRRLSQLLRAYGHEPEDDNG